jgi:hypothetical protein
VDEHAWDLKEVLMLMLDGKPSISSWKQMQALSPA